MKELFGTDGIRGRAGEFPLDDLTVETIGRSLARHFRERSGRDCSFVIGRDTRRSGPQIESAMFRGIMAENGNCESAGVITTPGVAFVTREFGFDAGIVVSASHNPFDDNGIKVFMPSGKKADRDLEAAVERDVAAGIRPGETAAKAGIDVRRVTEFQDAYLEYLHEQFDGPALSGVRLVIDCANGAASVFAQRLFEGLGASVIVINNEPNGENINFECGSTHMQSLCERMAEQKADVGIAFDGDADRVLFVDANSRLVDGDATLWILGRYLAEQGGLASGSIIATVMSNIGLELALKAENIELVRTDVGDKYVLDELLRSGAELGGEQSGHIILPNKSLVGDGMLTALLVLKVMKKRGETLAQLTKGFIRYPQTLVNTKVREKVAFEKLPEVSTAVSKLEAELAGKGRLLLRYSGTENLARVMIEGEDQAMIEARAGEIAAVIKAAIGA